MISVIWLNLWYWQDPRVSNPMISMVYHSLIPIFLGLKIPNKCFINNPAPKYHSLIIWYGQSLITEFRPFFGGTMDKTLIRYPYFSMGSLKHYILWYFKDKKSAV
jgi:hypothetical protein